METKGEWMKFTPIEATLNGEKREFITIAGEGGRVNVALIPTNYVGCEANAELIVSAVNACKSISDDPLAVAQEIKEMYEALKKIITAEDEGFECLGYGRSQNARKVLSNIEGK